MNLSAPVSAVRRHFVRTSEGVLQEFARGPVHPRTGNCPDPLSQTRGVTMLPTARSVLGAGVLAIGCLLGIGAPSVQAQAPSAQAQVPRYYAPAPVYSYPAPRYYAPAPVYSYPAPRYYAPAPVYTYSTPPYYAPAQGYSQTSRNYSYYDQDGIEHDSRYPHWSFDYNLWVQLNIK
jgi:hypothetical protein